MKPEQENGRGPSIRLRVFQLLEKHPNGLTGRQIVEKLGKKEGSSPPSLLTDECETGRIRREKFEEGRGVVYKLSATGKKALKSGKVDSEAPDAKELLEARRASRGG